MRVFFCLYILLLPISLYSQLPVLEQQNAPTTASLRGLSVLSEEVAWASGSSGTFLLTTDGGKSWQAGKIPGADTLDFRSVQAFSVLEALLMSAGQPARIYKTTDGGKNWTQVYSDKTGEAFFDAFAFWNEHEGLAMSDPVNGHFLLLKTTDGGNSWQEIARDGMPPAIEGEAGFAASGSGLVAPGNKLALFGTGGAVIRIFRSSDGGKSWQAIDTPLEAETASTGIYSISMKNMQQGIAVGGDYTRPDAKHNHLLITEDGGRSWQRIDDSGLGGYRSGTAFVHGSPCTYLAVGTNGMDISYDGGKSWEPLTDTGMHAIRIAPSGKSGWATGANGSILKLIFN